MKAKIEKVEAQSLQLREEMRSTVVELESARLSGLFIQIRDMEKILELGSEQIESAGERTAEEQKLYNQGRGLLQYKALMDELLPVSFDKKVLITTKYKWRSLS